MSEYFAAKEASKAAAELIGKSDSWYNNLITNGYLQKVKQLWMAHHGMKYASGSSHNISFGGEQGELVSLSVNHFRNLASHMLTMVTSNRPAFQARATNTDYKSLAQAKLANNLLDYYMREKRMEKYLKTAVEYAIVMGSGYVKMDWNATNGEMYDFNEDLNTPIYEGDVEFCNLSPFDVVFDTTKEQAIHQEWIMCRTFKNRYDLIAKYPEFEGKIKSLPTKTDSMRRLEMFSTDNTDDVAVYEFYHKRTESMPDGRYLLFLAGDIVLLDSPMPYRQLNVFRIAPSDILGTPFGYTPLLDILPIQDAIDSLYSTVLTNQNAFGVQSIYVPRGADISMKSLEGGMNIIEGNSGAGKPEAMNLTATPPEIFNFIKQLEQTMETISGVNSVSRGNPEASLKSGTALALVQSMSLQFISNLQQQYVQLIEDVGTGLVNMLKDFAAVPRIAVIAGKTNRAYVEKQFTGDDLANVNRVIVDLGNPVAQTKAGRLEIAQQLIQYGIVKTPEQYFTILNTGQLDALTDDMQDELLLVKNENERLSQGQPVPALAIDKHQIHINSHKSILSDPDLRTDELLTRTVLDHINEHINLLRSTDPALLSLIGEQPLGPIGGGTPPPQQGTDANQSAPPNPGLQEAAGMPPAPNQPSMPQVPANLLPNPEIQQQAMGNVQGG